MRDFLEKKYKFIIGAILLFMVIVSVLNAKNDSLIYDEDAHIPAAYSYLAEHDLRLNPEHPPLIKDLAAAPLLFMKLNFDTSQSFWNENPNDAQWNAGKYFLFNAGNNPNKIIFWSRLPIILISLLLGLFIFKWTRELAGISAGLFALTLYAFDPNILGHNHYVTTDLGIAAFMVFSFYYFIEFIKHPNWKNVFVSGLFLALMQLAKFSAVTAFPVFFLIIAIYPLIKNKKDGKPGGFKIKMKTLGKYLGKGIVMFAFSLVIIWIVYYFNIYSMPVNKFPETINYYFKAEDTNIKAVYSRKILFQMNDSPVFRPLAPYFFGIARVFQRVAGGNVTYFMGEISTKGFYSYFPIVFLIKEPLATLAVIFLALFISLSGAFRSVFNSSKSFLSKLAVYLRTNVVAFTLLLFIFVYSVTSIAGKLNIGFRHLFPILPFIFILTATGIFKYLKNSKNFHLKHAINISLVVLGIFLLFETVSSYPNYLSYFNQMVGGPKNGYRYVTDSNADWGQDLGRLKIFLENHPEIENIKIDYFGMADIKYYLGDKYYPWWAVKRPIEPGWYAISTLFLQEGIYSKDKADNESYRWLQNKKPLHQVGTSILIYYITPREAVEVK
jgi:hypothetical protein